MSRVLTTEEHWATGVKADSIAESIVDAIEQYESSQLTRAAILEALANVSAYAIFHFYKKQEQAITNNSANWFVEKFAWYLDSYLEGYMKDYKGPKPSA